MSGADLEVRMATRADVPAIVGLLADDTLGSRREDLRDPLPESYYEAFDLPPPTEAEIEGPPEQRAGTGAGSAACASEPQPNFRLRVGRGPRSRWIAVTAESESDAVEQAEKQAGEGWDLLEIELIEGSGSR